MVVNTRFTPIVIDSAASDGGISSDKFELYLGPQYWKAGGKQKISICQIFFSPSLRLQELATILMGIAHILNRQCAPSYKQLRQRLIIEAKNTTDQTRFDKIKDVAGKLVRCIGTDQELDAEIFGKVLGPLIIGQQVNSQRSVGQKVNSQRSVGQKVNSQRSVPTKEVILEEKPRTEIALGKKINNGTEPEKTEEPSVYVEKLTIKKEFPRPPPPPPRSKVLHKSVPTSENSDSAQRENKSGEKLKTSVGGTFNFNELKDQKEQLGKVGPQKLQDEFDALNSNLQLLETEFAELKNATHNWSKKQTTERTVKKKKLQQQHAELKKINDETFDKKAKELNENLAAIQSKIKKISKDDPAWKKLSVDEMNLEIRIKNSNQIKPTSQMTQLINEISNFDKISPSVHKEKVVLEITKLKTRIDELKQQLQKK